jgi:hypothetical protein
MTGRMGKTKLSITSGALNNFTVMLAGLGAVQIGCGWVGLVRKNI